MSKGFIIKNILHYSPKEAYTLLCEDALLVDIRRETEISYKAFDVPKMILMNKKELKYQYETLPKDKLLIVADNAGLRSIEATHFLLEKGFANVANLIGGMFEWDKDKLPIKQNNLEMLKGSCLCMLKPMNKVKKER